MDVMIIGAGASGLMCAYVAMKRGLSVLIIEKNEKAGKKIYITGKGRGNLTNLSSQEEFLKHIVRNPKFLYSALANFSPEDAMAFFEKQGVALQVERGKRVFPQSGHASDITKALLQSLSHPLVTIHYEETLLSIEKTEEGFFLTTTRGTYQTPSLVLATGGCSYSSTGSTGDGYRFAEKLGHHITPLVGSLNALKMKKPFPYGLHNLSLKHVILTAKYEKKVFSEFGDLDFYPSSIEGPIALKISTLINRFPPEKVSLEINLKPALSEEQLQERLIKEQQKTSNQNYKDLLKTLLPLSFVSYFASFLHVKMEDSCRNMTTSTRKEIIQRLHHFPLDYAGLDLLDRAIVTSGGVMVQEINSKTMESKLVPGLYFTGEIIDVDGMTGGYHLQIAWSTGYAAGNAIADRIAPSKDLGK